MLEILLVDDSTTFLNSMRASLKALPGVHIVGDARNGQEAVRKAALLHPQVILMDIAMPVLNGLEACKKLMCGTPAPAVIFLSTHDGPEYREAALQAGGLQFVTKSNFVHDLIPLIESLVRAEQHSSASG